MLKPTSSDDMQTFILIGGIASGKSTALACFKDLGIDCFRADDIARECVTLGSPYYQAILAKCGPMILDKNKTLNRALLRQKMLHDQAFKSWLESLLHPEIRQCLIHKAAQASPPYCVLEIPLLKHQSDYPHSQVIYIHTTQDRQRAFLKSRNLSPAEIEALLVIQIPEHISLSIADIVIENDGSLTDLKEKIHTFHRQYCASHPI